MFASVPDDPATAQIKSGFDDGKELVVTVLKVRLLPCSASDTLNDAANAALTQTLFAVHGRGAAVRCEDRLGNRTLVHRPVCVTQRDVTYAFPWNYIHGSVWATCVPARKG